MSGTQSEFTRHAQNPENRSHHERNGSIEIDPGLKQMLELANKCIKTVIIGLLVLTKMEESCSFHQILPLTNENP